MNANELAREIDPVELMDKAIIALYLELPESIANDVKDKWIAAKRQLSGVGGMKWVVLVRKAREFIREYVGDECTDSDYHDMVREMDDALSESPIPSGEQDGGWISVKDKRKPKHGEIIDTWNGFSNRRAEYDIRSNPIHFRRHVDLCEGDRTMIPFYPDITHWMPLPPPPKTITP